MDPATPSASLRPPLLTLLAACDARKPGTDTASASATVTDTAAGTWEKNKDAVPVTSGSDEARKLYLQGRTLSENLRAHDGRQLYEQAAAKDPSFAMAHYQLAANSATAKDFFAHLKEAVALSDKASEGERLTILALEAGGNANPAKALEYSKELVAKYPGRRAGPLHSGQRLLRPAAIRQGDRRVPARRPTINPEFSPAYNSLGYAYRQLEHTTKPRRPSRSTSSSSPTIPIRTTPTPSC